MKCKGLIEEGLLEIDNGHVMATKRGMKILNSVLVALMDDLKGIRYG